MSEDKPKKIAQRRCLGCLQSDDKRKLLRVVVKEGVLTLDKKHNQAGRGAYLHKKVDCYERCQSTKRWESALHLKAGSIKLRDLQRMLGDVFAAPASQKKIRL